MAKLKAIDVANFYIHLFSEDENDRPDNMKINKLLYFAQGYMLKRYNKPLFKEKIEAWKFGPVVPVVYHSFKACGKNPIQDFCGEFNTKNIDEKTMQVLFDVAREYGKYTSIHLKDLTHKKGTPWDKVYIEGENKEISKEVIKEHFDTLEDIIYTPDYSDVEVIDLTKGDKIYSKDWEW